MMMPTFSQEQIVCYVVFMAAEIFPIFLVLLFFVAVEISTETMKTQKIKLTADAGLVEETSSSASCAAQDKRFGVFAMFKFRTCITY